MHRVSHFVTKHNKLLPVYVYYNGKRIVSGILDQDKVFHKSVSLRHKLLILDAYGIDEPNFQELKAFKCREIELTERETGKKYRIDFDTFQAKAILRQIGHFGPRRYLPLRYWKVIEQVAGRRR